MSSPDKQLTDLEWEIMNHIWNAGGEVSVRQIIDEHYAAGEKAYTTVQTVMNTLVEKGFLTRKKTGMVNFYTPARKRESVVDKETNYFIHKVFRGSMPQFVKRFIGQESFTEQEIAELKEILAQKEQSLKGQDID